MPSFMETVLGALVGSGGRGYRLASEWSARRRLAGRVKKTPLRAISDIPHGRQPVAVQGRSRALEYLASPVSGEKVIGYRIHIEMTVLVDEDRQESAVADWATFRPFELVDEGGVALVQAGEPVFLAEARERDRSQFAVDLTRGALERLIQLEGLSVTDMITAKSLRVTEGLLRADDYVYVCGTAETVTAAGGESTDYRRAPTRVVFLGDELIVADCHRDVLLQTLRARCQ